MRSFAVLSGTGPDRTGLVAELTEFLLRNGANVEDSRMAVLGGDFAVIMLFSAEDSAIEEILSRREEISARTGLGIVMRRTSEGPASAPPSLLWRVRAVALDHQGIVHRFAQAVAERGVNILELKSDKSPAPVSGAPVFSMEMTVSVPAEEKPSGFREALVKIGEEAGVDIEIHPVS